MISWRWRQVDGAPFATHFRTANVVGTLVYMAPEYMRGGELTTKVDVFALGLCVVEALTGLPIAGPTPSHCDLLSLWETEIDAPQVQPYQMK